MEIKSSLIKLCESFDHCFIAEKQIDMNRKFISSSDDIFTDASNYDHKIDNEGYIVISNIDGANYVVFLDKYKELYLAIYQYTPKSEYQDIINAGNRMREKHMIGKKQDKKEPEKTSETKKVNESHDKEIDYSKLVDINKFTRCLSCNTELTRVKDNNSFVYTCNKCKLEYTLVPSRYYVIKSRKQFYSGENECKLPDAKTNMNQKEERTTKTNAT